MAFPVGTVRRGTAGALVALLALGSVSAGGQLVFGLDDYGPAGQGDGGRTTSSGTTGTGGATGCAPLTIETVSATSTGICGARRLTAFSDGVARELAPGAYCQGPACYVYFERRVSGQNDALMCGRCSNLGADTARPHQLAVVGVPAAGARRHQRRKRPLDHQRRLLDRRGSDQPRGLIPARSRERDPRHALRSPTRFIARFAGRA